MELLFFVISFLASIIGGICGIGGGIIIKPALDLSGLASIATVQLSFKLHGAEHVGL